jgi:hypothetical protein
VAAQKAQTSKSIVKSSHNAKNAITMTHERIEQDIADFMKSGGKIEKLGNTNTLKKIV